jgi:beta-1,4-mannosyl-glycoprotein beta-1,4-N-acetylglucosaminyltransferase
MTILFSLIVTFFLFSKIFPYAWIDFGYLIRPIWDKDPYVWSETIVHYYSEGLTMQERCHAHGWTYTPNKPTSAEGAADTGSDAIAMPTRKGKVYDAVIFSVELDMLEIRMRELYDVVDHFVILESSRTFTGIPKDAVFQDHRERYSFAEDKIIYKLVPLRELRRGEEPWVNEGAMRDEMTKLLWSTDIKEGDYVIFSDVDEIPSRNAVELLSSCNNVPQAVHINLQNYVYSYEFPVDDGGKNTPTIQQWPKEGLYYNRRQISSILFANAGKNFHLFLSPLFHPHFSLFSLTPPFFQLTHT